MKQFFKKLLFPRDQGILPYFWLLYLAFLVPVIFPLDSVKKILNLLIVIVFVIAYRMLYTAEKSLPFWYVIQLIISGYFALTINYLWLFIYVGWSIGFQVIFRRQFYWYAASYYLVLIACILATFKQYNFKYSDDILSAVILGAMTFFSLLASRMLYENIMRRRQLRQSGVRMASQQSERDRIARDLHDNLGQTFSMITIKSELAEKLIDKGKAHQAKIQIQEIQQLSRADLQLVRDIVSDLRQESLAATLVTQNQNLRAANIILLTQGEAEANH